MESGALFFHTSIDPKQKKRRLFIGSIIGGIGAFGLLLPLFYPTHSLSLFCTGLGLIGIGLIPFKRLSRLESFPITLKCSQDGLIFQQGSRSLTIHYAHITRVFYASKRRQLILELRYTLTPEPLKCAPWKRYYCSKTLKLHLPQFTKETFEVVKEIYLLQRR